MPSSTSTKHNAMPSSCHMVPTDAKKPGISRLTHHNNLCLIGHPDGRQATAESNLYQGLDFSR